MRALVYDPFLESLGGGERYAYAFANAIASRFDTDIAGPVIPAASDLERMGLRAPGAMRAISPRAFAAASRDYDLTFQISNRRPLPSRADRSMVMIQFPSRPFHWKHPVRYRPRRWRSDEVYVTNSEFSRSWCGPRWGVEAEVIFPPVELAGAQDFDKQARILAVGRFFKGYHDKRFDVLVDAFAGLPAAIRDRWELVIAGAARERTAPVVLADLKARAKGLNVRIVTDAPRDDLLDLYRTSTLFWQATGYGRSARHPERAEHFGIVLVEAMSHGCLPLAYRDGGAPEILAPLGPDVLWDSVGDLRARTISAIADPSATAEITRAATAAAAAYSPTSFNARIADLLRSRLGF